MENLLSFLFFTQILRPLQTPPPGAQLLFRSHLFIFSLLQDPNQLTLTEQQLAALSALNEDEEMAPMPSQDEVFGERLEKLTKEFEEDQKRIEKQQNENQMMVEKNLHAKLARRRQRRARLRIEEKEKIAFGGGQEEEINEKNEP